MSTQQKLQRRKRQRLKQIIKTLFLALFTLFVFIAACIYSLDIPKITVYEYLLTSIALLAVIILLALITVSLLHFFKKR